ncbi:hypothetical protein Hypma_005739 [Hypsizygus marmoreus]|uniref:Uncharacterized protein n=1 Tax=Hypsizygus marmoreus TaxID=39966 RepID=A0A369KD18_HYPMA|nr:hypothetical protein Hypma_005739 [Hypsizygus marmoreus]
MPYNSTRARDVPQDATTALKACNEGKLPLLQTQLVSSLLIVCSGAAPVHHARTAVVRLSLLIFDKDILNSARTATERTTDAMNPGFPTLALTIYLIHLQNTLAISFVQVRSNLIRSRTQRMHNHPNFESEYGNQDHPSTPKLIHPSD